MAASIVSAAIQNWIATANLLDIDFAMKRVISVTTSRVIARAALSAENGRLCRSQSA